MHARTYDRRMTDDLWQHDAWELAEQVRGGGLTASKLLDLSLARIEQFDPKLNAVCFVDADQARADAELVDRRVASGDDPGAVRRVSRWGSRSSRRSRGWPDTHASVLYADNVAEFDCTEVARLRAAGAVIVGLTTAPEHGMLELHELSRCTASPATRGTSSARRAARRADRQRRSPPAMFPACTGQRRRRLDPHPVVVLGPVRDEDDVRSASASGPEPFDSSTDLGARSHRALGARRGPLPRRHRRARRSPTRRRCRSRRSRSRIAIVVGRRDRAAARQARRVVVDARVRAERIPRSRTIVRRRRA